PILVRPSGRRLPGTSEASILLKAAVDKMITSASAPAASFASMVPTVAKSNDVAHPVACENCAGIALTAPLTARALMILRSDTGVPIPLAFDRASKQVTVLLIQVGGNMLTDADRKKAAQLLLTAERDRKPIVQFSSTWPSITFEDAYAIQNEVQRQKMAEGRKLIGHKVGLTSKAMQQSSQINEPDYGHLLDDMMIADGAKVPHANYCAPRVEVELAFILGKPLKGPGVGL